MADPEALNKNNDKDKPLELEVGPDQGNGSSTQRAQSSNLVNSNNLMSFGNG